MEIHFCDRCHESIPDPDFDSGKAVRVGGRSLHVPCAFRRAMPGPGRALTFLLALFAAGAAAYALVKSSAEPSAPAKEVAAAPDPVAMRAEMDQRIEDWSKGMTKTILDDVDGKLKESRVAEQAALDRLGKSLAEMDGKVSAYGDATERRFREDEKTAAEMAAWIKEVRDVASRTFPGPSAPPPRTDAPVPPTAPENPGAPPPVPPRADAPPSADPESARRHEADVQLWITRLKDPNEGIAFTATRKLADLKDLRAVLPLIEVLKTHKDYFTRQGAASTLGELKAADAVPALMEALEDKDDLVQGAASEALTSITEQDFKFSLVLTKKEKKQLKEQWQKWWHDNEADVRKRLGQAKG